MEQIEIRKMIIDRMVHLLCVGHVIPVIQYMRFCLDSESADKSLIRHFAAEVSVNLKTIRLIKIQNFLSPAAPTDPRLPQTRSCPGPPVNSSLPQVMEVTTSPYSKEFISEFLPIAKNPDITASLRNINESDSISQFIEYCGG